MRLPSRIHRLLLSGGEPGDVYRRCLEELAKVGRPVSYGLTEAVVYATEIRYALDVLRNGPPRCWRNFGDLQGSSDERLWSILDGVGELPHLAFVGSGPYPVTAFLIRERYPSVRLTCVDNNPVAWLLGDALFRTLGLDVEVRLEEALRVDFRPFNVVLVAAMVSGKRRLVERLLDQSDALIIVKGGTNRRHPRVVQLDAPFDDAGRYIITPV